jgi:hypothetical protein
VSFIFSILRGVGANVLGLQCGIEREETNGVRNATKYSTPAMMERFFLLGLWDGIL